MNLRQAAQRALKAMEDGEYRADMIEFSDALIALRAALAEPENQSQSQIDTKVNPAEPAQKPVAWMCPDDPDRATAFAWSYGYCIDCGKPRIPVYTAPTPRRPVELTDEEIALISGECAASAHRHDDFSFARAVIAAYEKKQGEQT